MGANKPLKPKTSVFKMENLVGGFNRVEIAEEITKFKVKVIESTLKRVKKERLKKEERH